MELFPTPHSLPKQLRCVPGPQAPRCTEAGVVLAPLDREAIELVWHRDGYPAGGAYLDTHRLTERRHRAWANDGAVYDADRAAAQVAADAEDFVERVAGRDSVVAFDTELPWHGVVASAELLLTQVNNALHFERLDLGAPTYTDGVDGRKMFWGNVYGTASGTRANGGMHNGQTVGQIADTIPGYENVTGWHGDGVLLMKNTGNGRSTQLTLSLNKPLVETWGWSLGYTYTNATEVNPLTSSRAISRSSQALGLRANI